jgi:hypothetical protein
MIELPILVTALVKAACASFFFFFFLLTVWYFWLVNVFFLCFLLATYLITLVARIIQELFVFLAGTKVDFRFSQRFAGYIHSAVGSVHLANMGSDVDVSEVHSPQGRGEEGECTVR